MEGHPRLDTIQAANFPSSLHVLDWTKMRNAVAAKYASAENVCATAIVRPNCRYHSTLHHPLQLEATRDNAQKHLTDNGIANQIYYPVSQ